MSATTQLMTADELLRMPDDGYRYELIRGELRKMSPAGYHHGKIAGRVMASLAPYVITNQLGEVCIAESGFMLSSNPDTVRTPDVAFIRRERDQQIGNTPKFCPGAPDLAVEVISPSDVYSKVEDQVFDWLDAGCQIVIVVNPDKRSVTVFRSRDDIAVLTEDDTLDGGDVVPGWSMPVKDIFPMP